MGPTTQVRNINASSVNASSMNASSSTGGAAPRPYRSSSDLETAYASRSRQLRLDMAEERSLSGAMVGLCAGWMAAGGAGALLGLAVGALLPIWQDR